jgi:O-antigen/teichoic acid export membrane protein
MFLELGLGVILTNFSSYEFSKIKWHNNLLIGNENAVKRSLLLIKKTIQWFSAIAVLFFILMFFVGKYFFSDSNNIYYLNAWIIFIAVFSPGLIFSPFLSILQGFGKVKEVQTLIFYQVFLSIIAFWIGLVSNFNIYALIFQFAIQNLVSFLYITYKYHKLIFHSLIEANDLFSWRNEILPLQLKTGFTWLVSYLGINLLIPFSFKIFGPETAGQLGMSFRIAEITSVVCLAWTNTRVPLMGKMIASNEKGKFYTLYFNTLKSILLIGFLFTGAIFVIFNLLDYFSLNSFIQRVLSLQYIMLIAIGYYMFAISNYLAMTIRSFKDEKMILPNIIALFIYSIAIFLSFSFTDYKYLILSFLFVNSLVLLPFSIIYIADTFNKKTWS